MARREFTGKTRKAALARSQGICEAVGAWYGLQAGKRCTNTLERGVEYDHIVLEANSHDNSLENCAAVCIPCHRHKSAKHDTPTAAKTVAQANMGLNLRVKAKILTPPKPPKPTRERLPALPPVNRFYKVMS